jgi:hypothetical protein
LIVVEASTDRNGAVNRSHNQISHSSVTDGVVIVLSNLLIDCRVSKVKADDRKNAIDWAEKITVFYEEIELICKGCQKIRDHTVDAAISLSRAIASSARSTGTRM